MATIGLFVGRENTFPQPFIDAVNARNVPGVSAELVRLGGTALDEELPYRVIVDRISHEVPYYRCYLKAAVLRGAIVINDPFWWGSDDKFLECHIARRLGVAVPKTLLVPNKDYIEGITPESLRNLATPLDWEAMLDYVGRPAILKPAIGGGWKNVYKVHDAEELVRCYDQTGQLQMILQEFIDYQQYVRCICLGRTYIQPIRYDPSAPFEQRYVIDDSYLEPDLRERVVDDARKLCDALGYDMNTVEFAIRDGVPYAIDFLNPAPDFDRFSITPHYFDWVIETMTDLVIAYAQGNLEAPRGYARQEQPLRPTPPPSPFARPEEAAPPVVAGAAVAEGETVLAGATPPESALPPATPLSDAAAPAPAPQKRGRRAASATGDTAPGEGVPEESGKDARSGAAAVATAPGASPDSSDGIPEESGERKGRRSRKKTG